MQKIKALNTKTFQKIFLVGFGNFFNAALGFLFLTAVARNLTVEDFGKYALLTSLLVVYSKILDFGTNSLFVVRQETKDNLATLIASKIMLLVIAVALALTTLTLFSFTQPLIMAGFVGGTIAYGINYLLFAIFQKRENFSKLVVLNMLPALIKAIAAILIFAGIITITLQNAFLIFGLSIFSSALLVGSLKLKLTKINLWQEAHELIKRAAPAGMAQLITEGYPAVSNTIIKLAQDFVQVGIFSVANKVAQVFTLTSLSIFTVLLPKNALKKHKDEPLELLEAIVLSLGIIALALIVILVSKPLVIAVFGAKYIQSLGVLKLLILASALTAIHTFMENYFYVARRMKQILVITTIKLVILIGLALALVPAFSISGVAWAHLLASLGATVLTLMLLNRI